LHAAAPGRDEHQIDQNRLQPFDVCLGCLDCGFGLVTFPVGRNERSVGRLKLVTPLIQHLLRYIPVLDQHFSSLKIRLRKFQIALALIDEREGFRHRLLRLDHLRLRGPELGFGFRRRDGGDDLAGRDLVTFILGHRRQTAGIFCRNIDLRRFDTAVRFHDPLGHIASAQAIDQRFDCRASFLEGVLRL
jgi:hypothetical protein